MNTRFLVRIVFCFLLIGFGLHQSFSAENTCQKSSPIKKNVLIELFTSDGCDSCPPANKWLSSVVKGDDNAIIPVSMHVTYWNHLGWKDDFSNSYFDARQDSYAKQAISKFSYTPQLILNAREWRGWRDGSRKEIANAEDEMPGRPEEFHLQPPTGPYVNLPIYTAHPSHSLALSR